MNFGQATRPSASLHPRGLTLRCTRLATACFVRFRERVNSNVELLRLQRTYCRQSGNLAALAVGTGHVSDNAVSQAVPHTGVWHEAFSDTALSGPGIF